MFMTDSEEPGQAADHGTDESFFKYPRLGFDLNDIENELRRLKLS